MMIFPPNWFAKITPLINDRGFTIVGSISQAHRIPAKQDPNKLILYNWDVYPWMNFNNGPWKRWGDLLKSCRDVWHSSYACANRTKEIYGVDKGQVIKTFVPVGYLGDGPIGNDNYVLMPVRHYHNDQCFNWATNACRELGIKLIWPNHDIPQKEYEKIISNSTLILSHYHEASTGGLGMIEGVYFGKSVVANASPYNGAREYMADHAMYFKTYDEMKEMIQTVFDSKIQHNVELCRKWIRENYDIQVMADRINNRLEELCEASRS